MDLLSRLPDPGQKVHFCPGCQTRDKRAPPFVPAWQSRLENRDKRGFPTETNFMFCSSEYTRILKHMYRTNGEGKVGLPMGVGYLHM